MLPFLAEIVEAGLGRVVSRGDMLQRGKHRCHGSLGVLIRVGSLVILEKFFEKLSCRILMADESCEKSR
jgi:hypothetical protein